MKKKGQSTIEVVILVIIVATVVLFMNRYVRRSVMGMLREQTDKLGDQYSISAVNNYNSVQTSVSKIQIKQRSGGAVYTDIKYRNQTMEETRDYSELNKEDTLF